jgi:glycosyltransferase involved in cell wall biosynthesis
MLVPGVGRLAEYYGRRGFNVRVKRVQTRRRIYPGLHTLQSLLFARELKEREVDVVLCNTFAAASRLVTAARMARLPCAIYVREYVSNKPLHRKILEHADRILVVSQDLGEHVSRMADPSKVRLVYDIINPAPILERAAAHRAGGDRLLPFPPSHPVIGLIGRITPFKQQDLFVRAIPCVLEQVPQARFIIAGSAQVKELDYEIYVRNLALELGVQDRVAFLGQRSDAVEIMTELAVLCLTSDREPLGRVILEAHLAGCPVAASNTGGPAEIIEDGVTGLLFPPLAVDSERRLAAQIVRILQQPELGRSLAQAARERIQHTFAAPDHAGLLARALQELVSAS